FDYAHHETIPGYIVHNVYASAYAMIFRNLAIPTNAIIDEAKVRFITSGETTNPNVKTRIVAELTVNPAPFTNLADYQSRIRAPSPIPWDDIEPWYTDRTYYSPDISAQIHTIINLPLWQTGKSICLFWHDEDDRSAHIDYTTRMADTYHHDPLRCPILIIKYHLPPGPPVYLQTPARYFTFRGKVNNILSPSVGPIFQHCHPGVALARFEHYIINDDTGHIAWKNLYQGQTFTPGASHKITSVWIKAYRVGFPGLITVGIRETVAGDPTDTDLCLGSTNGNTLTTDIQGEWREIPITAGVDLSAGVQYAKALRITSDVVLNYLVWRADGTAPSYYGGMHLNSDDYGNTWFKRPLTDFMFEEWGLLI
ncbi:unnamed protein product, partial [marine sediment metagenome]